ncbi:MAG TPA: GIY-YIG nuclease family protein [Candidatus Paceibacterota bacterium]|nr:GIY-YIG nuclease family protein [Candidatus Paceibacterota bacterium]
MKKYFVYAIKSGKDSRIYVGISENPERRLREHNNGDTKSTKFYRPWKIIYKKFAGTRINARNEEKKLKSGFGKEFLKSLRPNK